MGNQHLTYTILNLMTPGRSSKAEFTRKRNQTNKELNVKAFNNFRVLHRRENTLKTWNDQ